MTEFLDSLGRSWPSVSLPDSRPHPASYATYSSFGWKNLPPVPGWIAADFEWLRSAPVYLESTMAVPQAHASRDISAWRQALRSPADLASLPADFVRFADDATLREHLRSPTGCYFDLGEDAVEMPGGRLLNFLSDSQWCLHWLLYIGDCGRQAVVTTTEPVAFDDQEGPADPAVYEICADTFTQFLWRFWIESEIWCKVTSHAALTGAEADYVRHLMDSPEPG